MSVIENTRAKCCKILLMLIVMIAMSVITGCSSSDIQFAASRTADFSEASYGKILVYVNYDDKNSAGLYEAEIKEYLLKYSVQAETATEVFANSGIMTDYELFSLLRQKGYDACLKITISGITVDKYQMESLYKGRGYQDSVVKLTCIAVLFDIASAKAAWEATAKIMADSRYYTGGYNLARSFGKTLAAKMSADKLFKTPVKAN